MRPVVCRSCGDLSLRRLPLDWCADCWRQFLKGFAIALGAALAGHIVQLLLGRP